MVRRGEVVSRADIATRSGLTKATVSSLAAELIANGRGPSTLGCGADSTLPVTEIQVSPA